MKRLSALVVSAFVASAALPAFAADTLDRVPEPLREDVQERSGPRQVTDELVLTTLLNRFGAAGISELRDIRRDGDGYVAEVVMPDGEQRSVRIEAGTGEVAGL